MNNVWFVYVVRCADDSLYIGVAKDTQARVDVHNSGRGAKYTASRRPVKLVWTEKHEDQILTIPREIQIKKWRREKKENLIKNSILK